MFVFNCLYDRQLNYMQLKQSALQDRLRHQIKLINVHAYQSSNCFAGNVSCYRMIIWSLGRRSNDPLPPVTGGDLVDAIVPRG